MDVTSPPEELEIVETSWTRFRQWCARYDAKNLSLLQKIVGVLALIALFHFAIGLCLWGYMAYVTLYGLIRNSKSGLFWWNVWTWLPYFTRSWKFALPLETAVLAIYFLQHRIRLAASLVVGIFMFSAICAWYDITHQNWDFATFGGKAGGHMQYYFTWWWCHQRPW